MPSDPLSGVQNLSPGISGRPCWVDLVTQDPHAAKEFYAALLGWTYSAGNNYNMAFSGGAPVAGVYGPPTRVDQPAAWTLYLTVHDVGLTVDRVLELSGRIVIPPQDIPGQGSMLIAADPTGAPIGLWRQEAPWEFATGFPGAFTWAELNTWQGDVADEFFRGLFGFEQQQIGDGLNFDYTSWLLHGREVLGRLRMGPEFPAETVSHWMVYFGVSPEVGADLTAARASALGGRVLIEPFDSPYGRTAVIEDVTGATFTVIDGSRRITVVPDEVIGARVDDPNDD